MTGPEHYKAAEQLLHDAESSIELVVDHYLLAAQVHATLAAAAATATPLLPDLTLFGDDRPGEAWRAVIL